MIVTDFSPHSAGWRSPRTPPPVSNGFPPKRSGGSAGGGGASALALFLLFFPQRAAVGVPGGVRALLSCRFGLGARLRRRAEPAAEEDCGARRPPVALKGAYLAYHAYPSPALRAKGDYDLWLPEGVREIHAAAQAEGEWRTMPGDCAGPPSAGAVQQGRPHGRDSSEPVSSVPEPAGASGLRKVRPRIAGRVREL